MSSKFTRKRIVREGPQFRVPVHKVLEGALDADLEQVVVIGLTEDDEIYVASSTTTPVTHDLIERAVEEIENLAESDDEDEDDAFGAED
ncbi:hypothetical protein MARCHEWKA_00610 [Brevundimonas phage vB_BpoS-Marchewka]|uniref:Uncharacterized protein n=1 Tax=Brevundimonas phage vB_BpoS-Marchewka TaxID=2948604 RepID=A0A9E7N581_9CAUD|nr:hypothetical protein MARCHEWKA_00610 [Brevundimonas phage vB_BpoS-Marchewka]UTC29566.1 hypothetical protein BAMBUS_05080 [Brevundimonas phage vB_BpoS-Bambus]